MAVAIALSSLTGCGGKSEEKKNQSKATNQNKSDGAMTGTATPPDGPPKSKENKAKAAPDKAATGGQEASGKESASTANPAAAAVASSKVLAEYTGDWTMWGGTIGRNMVNDSTGVSIAFDPEAKKGFSGRPNSVHRPTAIRLSEVEKFWWEPTTARVTAPNTLPRKTGVWSSVSTKNRVSSSGS